MSKVLIIGGSRGIGAEAVRQFRAAGHDVVFTYHRSELDADALRQETGAAPVRCDVKYSDSVRIAVEKAVSVLGQIDVLICNAAIADFNRDIDFPIDVVLVTEFANEENEDEWVFPLEGDSADLDDIVRTVFVLNLDSKLLCKKDCKGLCCRCGKNLNDGPCNCQKELDPRFAALKQLLEK